MHPSISKHHYLKTLPGLIAVLYVLAVLCLMLFNAGSLLKALQFGQQDLEALNWVVYGVFLGIVNALAIGIIALAVIGKKDTIIRKEILLREILWFLFRIFLLYFFINLIAVLMLSPGTLLFVFLSELVGLLPIMAGLLILKRI
jgi:hypothetical protein